MVNKIFNNKSDEQNPDLKRTAIGGKITATTYKIQSDTEQIMQHICHFFFVSTLIRIRKIYSTYLILIIKLVVLSFFDNNFHV